jgi:hypothetical protein
MHYKLHVHFSHIFELHHGLKLCCACPYKALDGGLCQVPHLNQNTQASIKSYHEVLKHWFFLETKGLRGCRIDWLVWRLTTTVAWHYMHQVEMKREGFIKNKVMAWLVVASVDKTNRIPHTDLISPTFKGDDGDNVWGCETNTILVLLTRSVPLSLSRQVTFVNGHCEATFANIKLLFIDLY